MRFTNRDWVGVTVLLLVAAALRFLGLSYGQPNPQYLPSISGRGLLHEQASIHPDEYFYVATPLNMVVKGRGNPDFFENPSFLINLNAATFWLTGEKNHANPDDWEGLTLRNIAPFHLYVIGRVYSALGGLLAVAATFAAGRMLGCKLAGFTAGVLIAFSFPMIQHAHYATTSSLAAGFTVVCVWASFASLRSRRFRWQLFVVAGLAAGLAGGNRYNAGAVSIVVFVAGLILLNRYRNRGASACVLAGWLAFPVAFLVTSPYVVLDFARFWDDFSMISVRFSSSDAVSYPAANGLWLEYRYLVVFGLSVPAAFLVVLGLWAGWRERRAGFGLLLCYILPYSAVVLRTVVPEIGDQLTVPVLPAFAIIAGLGAVWIDTRFAISRWILSHVILVGIVVVPLPLSLTMVSLFLQVDTREVAQEWIHEHLPTGSHIHLLGPYNVALDDTTYQTQQTFAGSMPTVERLREQGIDYVVISDAWIFFDGRKSGYVPTDVLQGIRNYYASFETVEQVYFIDRPRWPGYDWLTNNASYWHHPAIRVICLTEKACGEVKMGS